MQPTECSATPMHGKPGTAGERSFIMVKPEGVARGLVSEIIGRWEKRGYTLVAIKVVQPDASWRALTTRTCRRAPSSRILCTTCPPPAPWWLWCGRART